MKYRTSIKTALVAFLILNIVLQGSGVFMLNTYAAPSYPSRPDEPDAPTAPDDPRTPTPTPTPRPTRIPTPTPTPTAIPTPTPTPDPSVQGIQTENEEASITPTPTPINVVKDTATENAALAPTYSGYEENSGNQKSNDNVDGPVVIDTGDAEVQANLSNQANINTFGNPTTDGQDVVAVIEENGADSGNVIDILDDTVQEVSQTNNLEANNIIDADVNTGKNTIINNLGGGSTITTGDATANVNVINFGNVNMAGVGVAEYNVFDPTGGDIYLDDLSYIPAEVLAQINKNGAGSDNTIEYQSGNTKLVFQDNYAEVTNDINIEVNTGDNTITQSLGDATIQTGDANVVANIINFLNSNFLGLGKLLVGVINLADGYQGDVYLPTLGMSDPSVSADINNNGANSLNQIGVSNNDTLAINQKNTVGVNNEVYIDANTGDNTASMNVGNGTSLKTGDIETSITSSTVAGQNFVGTSGIMNLVFLNENGKITPFYVDAQGNLVEVPQVYAEATENGAYSENIIGISEDDSTTVDQNNTAIVNNKLNIDVNTGGNKATRNVDSKTTIETGDISVLASITNFIGNNFVGDNLVVTFINSLGEWTGNILPGWMRNDEQEQGHEEGQTENIGGLPDIFGLGNDNATDVSDEQTAAQKTETGTTQNEVNNASSNIQPQTGIASKTNGSGVLGSVFAQFGSNGGSHSDENSDEGIIENDFLTSIAGKNEGSQPVYRPTISTEGSAAPRINIGELNPFAVFALGTLIVIANLELKKRLSLA